MPKLFELFLGGFLLLMTVLFTVNVVTILRTGRSLWGDKDLTGELRRQYYFAPPVFCILTIVTFLIAFRLIGNN